MGEITMPQLGESVTEGTITKWFKNIGDHINEDEPLFEVSTDKVDTEVPAPAGGYLAEIRVPEGDTVDVGTVIAVLSDQANGSGAPAPGAAPPAPAASVSVPVTPAPPVVSPPPAAPPPQAATPSAPAASTQAPVSAPAAARGGISEATEGRLLSPLVRKLIDENQLDPADIPGTGVGGRITHDDVLGVIDSRAQATASTASAAPAAAPPVAPPVAPEAPAPPPGPPAGLPTAPAPGLAVAPVGLPAAHVVTAPRGGERDTVERLNNIRLRTGEHMAMSKAVSPHAITAIDVDYESVERVRKPLREEFRAEEGFPLTYLPFISRALVDALLEFPHMNATVGDGELVVHNYVNLSLAVDLEYQGLLAPVIRDADGKRLRAIAREINDLAGRARTKKLSPDELAGGTFTISNSGSWGTLFVAPIINQPQVAILSTDGVKRRPIVVELPDGSESIAIHSVGNLTLSWDHRAFDGAYAAAFVSRVKQIIETRDWSTEL